MWLWLSILEQRFSQINVRKHLLHHSLFYLAQIGFAVLAFRWWLTLPVPGYAIAVLAVLAAIMSVHMAVEVKWWQQAFWMLLIGAFLFLEFRAINKDRAEFAAAEECKRKDEESSRKLENEKFGLIVDSLKRSLKQTEFGFKEGMSTLTGGNTYCYLVVESLVIPKPASPIPMPIMAILKKHGEYPLYTITMQTLGTIFMGSGETQMLANKFPVPDLPAGDKKERYETYLLQPYTLQGESVDIDVAFRAKNGVWHQLIRLRRIETKKTFIWLTATRVYWMRLGDKLDYSLIWKRADKGFPMEGVTWNPHLLGE